MTEDVVTTFTPLLSLIVIASSSNIPVIRPPIPACILWLLYSGSAESKLQGAAFDCSYRRRTRSAGAYDPAALPHEAGDFASGPSSSGERCKMEASGISACEHLCDVLHEGRGS